MIVLSKLAREKYSGFTSALAKDIAQGNKNSPMIDFINMIHDKYKVVQLYPNLGKDDGDGMRNMDLGAGWHMLYRVTANFIEVIDFVNGGSP